MNEFGDDDDADDDAAADSEMLLRRGLTFVTDIRVSDFSTWMNTAREGNNPCAVPPSSCQSFPPFPSCSWVCVFHDIGSYCNHDPLSGRRLPTNNKYILTERKLMFDAIRGSKDQVFLSVSGSLEPSLVIKCCQQSFFENAQSTSLE